MLPVSRGLKNDREMQMIIPLDLGENSYDIVLERGALQRAAELLDLSRRVLIVTDTGVPAEYALQLKAQAEAAGSPATKIVTIPQGEGSKVMANFEFLLKEMLEASFTRKDCAVAVGGGVVGDLTAFAASCYMRGIDFYNIPTTLLSQVDSSIGGKTAIDFCGVKNIVGSFFQPKKVIIDPDCLKTLPQRQISAGLAESIKMSLTSDAELFGIIKSSTDLEADLTEIIRRSLIVKRDVVQQDPKEKGLRKILNFGHTIGHAIEARSAEQAVEGHAMEASSAEQTESAGAAPGGEACGQAAGPLLHGECVALGMLPMCSQEVRAQLVPVLEKYGLPTDVSAHINVGSGQELADVLMPYILHDKKMQKGSISIVRVEKPGSFVMENVDPESLRALI